MPWSLFLHPNATLKNREVIVSALEEHLLQADKEVICYCTGGVRSAWLYFVLKYVGYKSVRNYPGSWWEWSRDYGAPVEKDAKLLHKIIDEDPARPTGT